MSLVAHWSHGATQRIKHAACRVFLVMLNTEIKAPQLEEDASALHAALVRLPALSPPAASDVYGWLNGLTNRLALLASAASHLATAHRKQAGQPSEDLETVARELAALASEAETLLGDVPTVEIRTGGAA